MIRIFELFVEELNKTLNEMDNKDEVKITLDVKDRNFFDSTLRTIQLFQMNE